MKKMVITVCIEGNEEKLEIIKGQIIETACSAMVDCCVAIIGSKEQPIECVKIQPL